MSCTSSLSHSQSYVAGNIQFDDPILAFFCDEKMLQGMEEQGVDSKALLALYFKVYNDIIADHPDDMTVGIHLCRGNFKVRRIFSQNLPEVADGRNVHRVITSARVAMTGLPPHSSRTSLQTLTTFVLSLSLYPIADLAVPRSLSTRPSVQAPSSLCVGSHRTSRSCSELCRANHQHWRTRTSW